MIGQSIGHYRIIEKLGEGGMGVVYRAEDTRLGREVAIKALPAEYARDAARRQRFEKEARAAAALNHPGIAAVYALEAIGNDLYIVFEYVRGVSLRAILESGRLSLAAAHDLAAQMADALAAAHAAGVVHRDLKPENVLRTPDGKVKILDFGLAHVEAGAPGGEETASVRLTAPGMVVGTVWYMSPEQLEGSETDFRSDIFSFGVLLYELCAGARPFDGASTTATISRILTADPPPLAQRNSEVSGELERIVRKCLRKKREERYQSTSDLRVDLEEVRRQSPGAQSAPLEAPAAATAGQAEPDNAAADSSLLRRATPGGRGKPLHWWETHQIFQFVIAFGVIYLAWVARAEPATAWVFPYLLVLCSIVISLRVYLAGMAMFNPYELGRHVQRVEMVFAVAGLGAVVLLWIAGAKLFPTQPGLAAIMIAVGIGGAFNVFLIEPAIRRGAFPSTASGQRRAAPRAESAADSSLLRRVMFRSGATPLRWWELNHFFCIGATPVVLYFVWLVRDARKDELGLWLYYASLAFAAVLISLRLYQLAVAAFVPQQAAEEVQRVEPWQRRGDLLFMVVLLAAAASVAEKRIAVAAFLGVIALGGVVTRLLIEPAVSRAAFPSSAEMPSASAAQATATVRLRHRFQVIAIEFLFLAPTGWAFWNLGSLMEGFLTPKLEGIMPVQAAAPLVLIFVVVLIKVWAVTAVVRNDVETLRPLARWSFAYILTHLPAILMWTTFLMMITHTNIAVLLLVIAGLVALALYQRRALRQLAAQTPSARKPEN